MNTKLKMALAILASAAMPLVAVAPANAVALDRLNILVDCSTDMAATAEEDHNIGAGDVLTVRFRDCDGLGIWDNDNTGNAFLPGGTVINDSESQDIVGDDIAITVDGAAYLEVDTTTLGFDSDFDVWVKVAGDGVDPTSTLLATKKVTLGLGAPDTMIREEMVGDPVGDDGDGDIYMGGDQGCEVEPGSHVYKSLGFTVTTAGVYDFRAVNVSPFDEDMYWGVEKYPSSDPFLALYEGFDPNDPEANVVGCNDDSDDNDTAAIENLWNGGEDSLETGTGFIMDDQWPWFRTELEPGNYTLVYMTYSTVSTANFDAGVYGATSTQFGRTWSPKAQSTTFEIWGPEGGLAVGEGLAPTGGVEPSFALWAGLGIAGVGVAMAVSRRRAQRA